MSSNSEGLTVLQLLVENVRGAKRVTVTPRGTGTVKIKGNNGAGKSSILDAIQYALGGKAAQPQKPIRNGETAAQVVADLGKFRVRRTWTSKGSYLTVERPTTDGALLPVPSPQAFLDELCGQGIGFDPLAFTQKKPAEQVQTLLDMLSLPEDPRDLDAKRKELYDQRTLVNRQVKQAEAAVANAPHYPDAPAQGVSMADLLAEHNARTQVKAQNDAKRTHHERLCQSLSAKTSQVGYLRMQLIEAEAELAEAQMYVEESAQSIEALVDPDPDELAGKLREMEAINAKVRANQQHARLVESAAVCQEQSAKLTAALEGIDRRKTEILTQAAFPVHGLSIAEDGRGGYVVTYHEVPLADCSSSEQLRVSMALAMALNPKVKVILVREGSLLDQDSLATVEQWATENGCQCWLEMVGTEPEEGSFVIEAGELQEVQP